MKETIKNWQLVKVIEFDGEIRNFKTLNAAMRENGMRACCGYFNSGSWFFVEGDLDDLKDFAPKLLGAKLRNMKGDEYIFSGNIAIFEHDNTYRVRQLSDSAADFVYNNESESATF